MHNKNERARRTTLHLFLCAILALTASNISAAPARAVKVQPESCLALETKALSARCLKDIQTLADWQSKREGYRQQLQEMLGLWPMPERTDLKAVVTGKREREDLTVENIHFQASPGLYVTANLYLPRNLKKPVPAVLYVCGHSQVVTNGVSFGGKARYQYHGAWFAQNGYACLMIDTLQYGEILGHHRGTYSDGQWSWNARGYSPAGVEAWFGIRALDYLCSRPEVDKERIGMTGRSGGGSYSWTVAALDERVKVTAPIAGITDLENQVVDGAVEGHCDCMFYVNTYRWDFPMVPALIAPRPLLYGNSDDDAIFPLDGVVRTYEKTRRIYELYGARENLGLVIVPGGHKDTQELQLSVLGWFNQHLKNERPLVESAAKPLFAPQELRVFKTLPKDQVNTIIQERFIPAAKPIAWSKNAAERRRQEADTLAALRQKVFAGWPEAIPPKPATAVRTFNGLECQTRTIVSQPGIELPLFIIKKQNVTPNKLVLTILDEESWTNSPARALWNGNGTLSPEAFGADLKDGRTALAFFAPREVPASFPAKSKGAIHLRRRYMLLGQTLDSMRVWDIRCALQALQSQQPRLRASGPMAVNAAYAALFEPSVSRLELDRLPASHLQGPDYLNVLKIWDIPQLLEVLGDRVEDPTPAG